MAYELNFQTPIAQFESNGDVSLNQKWDPISAPATASESVNGCFDCNICLESAHDPVVTLCGHLYCWPCIFKWLHVQNPAFESPNCPVCKSKISRSSLVPLYGRGSASSESDSKKPQREFAVPHRPQALGMTSHHHFESQAPPFHHHRYFPNPYGNYTSMEPSNFGGGMAMTGIFPTVVTFGEMVFGRMFGGSDSNLFAYHPYSNAYPFGGGNGSPRMRRQDMQVEKSLSRVTIFLLCCFVLCLLLF
ncbi:RING-type E3 ubiquitin transferase [Sarracenia purpurea var. burkii]